MSALDAKRFHRPLHDDVADRLGQDIVLGRYAPGQRLPTENEGADRFGISRNSYREAMRVLAAKGLLISRPKIGALVTPRSDWQLLDPDVLDWSLNGAPNRAYIRELFELRYIIEPAAAALAARKRSDAQLERMRVCLATMRDNTLADEIGRQADRLFHTTLMESTGNAVLQSLSDGIITASLWSTSFLHRRPKTDARRDPIPDHARVWQAIADQDAEAARHATVTLLLLAQDDIRAATLSAETQDAPQSVFP
ncbi:MAG TPA: FadR/GntR family transcriptional regulator [Asticcacaulis sp.]|nr:FadR/GntR family transcriptional regulator [Asticcacaulis sp.]